MSSRRSNRFRGVEEQRKTEERDFWCYAHVKNGVRAKKGRGRGRGRKETLADFVDRSFEKGCLKNDENLMVVLRLLA